MKRLGIVGGIGPESTIAYYRAIIGAGRETSPDRAYPPMLINSIDVQRVLQLVADGKLAALTEYLVAEVDVLEKSGAALGLIAASTSHKQKAPAPAERGALRLRPMCRARWLSRWRCRHLRNVRSPSRLGEARG